jgi:8-oxo-dGTP pyrophosphatase MutT (NUDIX family)
LPKGQIDPGEKPIETAVRETYEETGVEARAVEKLGDVKYVYTWEGERIFKVVSFFLLRPIRGRLGDLPPGMEVEVEDVQWLLLEDAPRLLTYGGEKEMARRAIAALATGTA